MSNDETQQINSGNDNPWYLLATMHGEETSSYASSLREKNRIAWNRWMASALTYDQRERLQKTGILSNELNPLTDSEKLSIEKLFQKRAGREGAAPPDPDEIIDLQHIRFASYVNFSGFIFPRMATIAHSVFEGHAFFGRAVFLRVSSFLETEFRKDVDFSHALFAEDVYFSGTKFCRASDFTGACMSSLATFEESQFHWAAGFSGAIFEHHADFRKTEFVTAAVFDYAKFGGRIQFNGSKCGLQMKLDHAVFNYHVPEFFEAELPEAIEFHGAVWPEPPKHDSEAAQLHTYAYQRLKAEMERLKRHEDEQYFFAKEMRSKRVLLRYRVLEGGWGLGDRLGDLAVIGADAAYDFFASYGRSIGKPIFWLFLLFAFGTVAFAQISSLTSGSVEWCDAAGLSATNLFSFLPYKPSKLLAESLTPTGKIIGDIQSLFGLILLFLLGLGLRNRFRMK